MITTQGPSGRAYHHASHGTPEDVIHFTVEHREFHLSGFVVRDVTVEVTIADVLRIAADHVRARRIDFYEQATDREVLGLPEPTA